MVQNKSKRDSCDFCSLECANKQKITKIEVECSHCLKKFQKTPSQMKLSKSGRSFCSKSCSATYNNLHKKTGTRRSKLEAWIEEQLSSLYPNLDILYNDKSAINSELDIYIPSLRLAIELNGIYHYEPIHGKDKFAQIQNNDANKFQACIANNISLCIVDASSLKYFKPSNAQKYLDIVTDIIDSNVILISG
jgi:hypothetical protein